MLLLLYFNIDSTLAHINLDRGCVRSGSPAGLTANETTGKDYQHEQFHDVFLSSEVTWLLNSCANAEPYARFA
jgi:hypothetical protein